MDASGCSQGFSTEWTSFPGVTENMGFIYTMMALSMLASGPTPVRCGRGGLVEAPGRPLSQ
jgi:hypothetical protein